MIAEDPPKQTPWTYLPTHQQRDQLSDDQEGTQIHQSLSVAPSPKKIDYEEKDVTAIGSTGRRTARDVQFHRQDLGPKSRVVALMSSTSLMSLAFMALVVSDRP